MRFGVVRVVDAEILWLTAGGKFRELSPLTWAANREEAFQRARRVRGLVVRIPEDVNEAPPQLPQDRRQRVFSVLPDPEPRKKRAGDDPEAIAPATDEARTEMVRKMRAFRQQMGEAPLTGPLGMRNYVALNMVRINYNFSSTSDPPVASVWITATSREKVPEAISWAQTQMGFFTICEVEDLGIYYFPLDKANLSAIWNYAVSGFPLNGPVYQKEPFTDDPHAKDDKGNFLPAPNTPLRGFADVDGKEIVDSDHTKPETGNPPPMDMCRFLSTLYALTYQRGCLGYAATIRVAMEACIKGTLTQAQVDAASKAYNACLARG